MLGKVVDTCACYDAGGSGVQFRLFGYGFSVDPGRFWTHMGLWDGVLLVLVCVVATKGPEYRV